MKLKRATGSLRDFGATWDIWSEAFINYTMIMVDFFGVNFPTLCHALLLFWTKIRKLSKIYEWQNAILPLAVDYHTDITSANHTDVEAWTLPQSWIDQYCPPNYIFTTAAPSSRKQAAITPADGHVNKKKVGEICRNFNTKECLLGENCFREHKCSECNLNDHGATTCTKRKQ